MSTRAVYQLLDTGRLTSVHDGARFRTGRRTDWTFHFDLGALDGLTDITVQIQASPTGNDDDEFEVIHSVLLSAVGTTTVKSGAFNGREINERDLVLRAIISAVTGTGHYSIVVRAVSPWFDPTDDSTDLLLLRGELRKYDDSGSGEGRTRIVEESEAAVLALLRQDHDGRIPVVDLDRPLALDTMKAAIALQSNHDYQRDKLARSNDPSSKVSLRQMGKHAPGLSSVLTPIYWNGTGPVWRGR